MIFLYSSILSLVITTITFFLAYNVYKKENKPLPLFWFTTWGAVISLFTLTTIIGLTLKTSPEFINFWKIYTIFPRKIADSLLVMLCIYPGVNGVNIFGISRRSWVVSLVIGVFLLSCGMLFRTAMNSYNIHEIETTTIMLIPSVISAYVLGRLLESFSQWGKKLRLQVFFSLISCLSMHFIGHEYLHLDLLFMLLSNMVMLSCVMDLYAKKPIIKNENRFITSDMIASCKSMESLKQ
jgi:hypothetical protein